MNSNCIPYKDISILLISLSPTLISNQHTSVTAGSVEFKFISFQIILVIYMKTIVCTTKHKVDLELKFNGFQQACSNAPEMRFRCLVLFKTFAY